MRCQERYCPPSSVLLSTSLFLLFFSGCTPEDAPKASSEKPAKVEPHPSESDLYRVILTAKAEQRLQIKTVQAQRQAVPRTRLLGGQLLVPDGARIAVTAPLTGTLAPIKSASTPLAGQHVKSNEKLFELHPILRPELEVPGAAERVQMADARASLVTAQIQADGEYQQALAQVEAASIALNRARKLLEDRAGSQRAVDDAEATYNISNKALEAVTQRKKLLDDVTLDADSGSAPIVSILAPTDGTLQTVSAQVGQVVSAGALLLEIVDLKTLWVRVPVYAGQVHEVDLQAAATMRELSERGEPYTVRPVKAPPTADPIAASIDLYFEVDNSKASFRPGERVSVHVPLVGEVDSLVVPRAAILRDIHGTAWIYTRTGEHEFQRERVSIKFTTDELAVLDQGPAVGTEVVVDGAAELFGTEFGAGK